MNINIKATNITLPGSIREYLEKKIKSIEKLVKDNDVDLIKVDVELGRLTNHHRSGDIFRAEVNLQIGQNLLRAVCEESELSAAIDIVKDEIVKEIKRLKDRLRTKIIGGARKIKTEKKSA
ncbi:MAG: ribosome-associated translation inhibitor RaiA [Candidatus Vogelbacteria bacterium]|nr:ribosome-associated translation inhibitor RaiA [Candidatus Vogelbacteria bacterium]